MCDRLVRNSQSEGSHRDDRGPAVPAPYFLKSFPEVYLIGLAYFFSLSPTLSLVLPPLLHRLWILLDRSEPLKAGSDRKCRQCTQRLLDEGRHCRTLRLLPPPLSTRSRHVHRLTRSLRRPRLLRSQPSSRTNLELRLTSDCPARHERRMHRCIRSRLPRLSSFTSGSIDLQSHSRSGKSGRSGIRRTLVPTCSNPSVLRSYMLGRGLDIDYDSILHSCSGKISSFVSSRIGLLHFPETILTCLILFHYLDALFLSILLLTYVALYRILSLSSLARIGARLRFYATGVMSKSSTLVA